MLMITHLASKQLTLGQSTWDGVGFVPGLLAGVDTVELIVSLVDTEDLSAELKTKNYVVIYFLIYVDL